MLKQELRVSITEAAVAVVTIISATAAMFAGQMSSDAYVGLIGLTLGYVFGRVRNGKEIVMENSPNTRTHTVITSPPVAAIMSDDTVGEDSAFTPHEVPGTQSEESD